ncbi:serine/threonine-protein kinase [Gordonia sp. (in: high G+C Gram-positive bacteria)]|uniref:serine/threonine-protein kinase n=1 Tax=Gordonia sp. (in: high G+C Gram-positive bacteria) TaxID=84139 RepID=UPI003F944A15
MEFTEIAGYRVIRPIGTGGLGQVFLAEHPRLLRHDALKLLDAGVSRSGDFAERFRREADVLAQLSHPNIVTLHDRGEFDGRLWISMEYVDGTDAGRLVAEHGPLDRDLVRTLVSGAGTALDHAWRKRQVTHRDVKPANILVGLDDGRIESVKLADFGVAKAVAEAASELTVDTVQYMSPETIEGRQLDNRADIYSLGCTAFHLLTGRPPHPGDSVTSVLSAHLDQDLPCASDLVPGVPPTVDAVFAKVLTKSPDDRYASCGAFVDALSIALGDGGDPAFAHTMTAASSHTPMSSLPGVQATFSGGVVRPSPKSGMALAFAIAAAATVLLAGAAVLGVYIARSSDSGLETAAITTHSTSTTPVAPLTPPPTTTVTAGPTTEEVVAPDTTWTPDETVPTTTVVRAPYEGMPCSPAEFGDVSPDGTLGCSGMDGAWRDRTHQSRPAVQLGTTCTEPGARGQVTASDQLATCIADSSGGYSWQP